MRLLLLTQLKISNVVPTNKILDTEWSNRNSIWFQWIFWHIASYVPNWVHVQFWSSAKIHQTSLRFQDTYVLRIKLDTITRMSYVGHSIYSIIIHTHNLELNTTFNCNKIDRPDKISKRISYFPVFWVKRNYMF